MTGDGDHDGPDPEGRPGGRGETRVTEETEALEDAAP
jgi:hypothetical protein